MTCESELIDDLRAEIADLQMRAIPVEALIDGVEVAVPGQFLGDLLKVKQAATIVCKTMADLDESPDGAAEQTSIALGEAIALLAEEFNSQTARDLRVAGVILGHKIPTGEPN